MTVGELVSPYASHNPVSTKQARRCALEKNALFLWFYISKYK